MQTLSCGMWDLVPRPGIKPGPPALGAWSLSHWTTRAVPEIDFWLHFFSKPPHFHHEPNTPLFSQLLWGHSPHGVHNVFWVHIQMFCTCHKCDVPVLLAPLVTGSKVLLKEKESMCPWGSLLGCTAVKRDIDGWKPVLRGATGLVRDLKTIHKNCWKG